MTLSKEHFLKTVADHKMTIQQDNDVFRHIVFSRPDSGSYRFHLTTFPEYLVITGDCGNYAFRRLYDMFEFFRTKELKINEGYWAEKVVAKDKWNGLKVYSGEKIKTALTQDFEYWLEDEDDKEAAREEFEKRILSFCDDEIAFNALGEVELDCGYPCNTWQFSAYEFCDGFLWCLYAIAWGIQQYDDAKSNHDDGGSK